MLDSDIIMYSADVTTTESAIDAKCPPEQLFEFLRARKTTGKIEVDLNEGGIRRIVLSEKAKK